MLAHRFSLVYRIHYIWNSNYTRFIYSIVLVLVKMVFGILNTVLPYCILQITLTQTIHVHTLYTLYTHTQVAARVSSWCSSSGFPRMDDADSLNVNDHQRPSSVIFWSEIHSDLLQCYVPFILYNNYLCIVICI